MKGSINVPGEEQRPAFAAEFTSATRARKFIECVRNELLHDGEIREGQEI